MTLTGLYLMMSKSDGMKIEFYRDQEQLMFVLEEQTCGHKGLSGQA